MLVVYLKELQVDVSQVKRVQAKTSMDITAIFERLDEADGRIMDLETENTSLATEVQKGAKHCEDEKHPPNENTPPEYESTPPNRMTCLPTPNTKVRSPKWETTLH